ncbi:MAG: isocitrate dehydrogenase [Candidatus Deianiraeaceae bacterium]|jgi:isocitrate dehydrogenase
MLNLPITVARGDGIGPYLMDAVLNILHSAGAKIDVEEITVGEKSYLDGCTSGITEEAWKTIHKNRIFLKAPITTPQGSGYKSLNVTIRKALGLYANVRPCRAYYPFVQTNFPELDLTIIRENEEDLYAGVEYQLTPSVTNTLKILTKEGTEKIIRYAFEYAVKNGRKKVTCMTKDNIMKIGDGMFHSIFNDIASEYPNIEMNHYIVDIGSARLASSPQNFDVIVTLNLYGDIISDIVAEVSGSVGLAGSSNIGTKYAMFEAIHGSAPAMKNKKAANPSGLLSGAIMMLAHIGQGTVATRIQNALFKTIEDGIATKDFYRANISTKLVETEEFSNAIIANLGNEAKKFKSQVFEDFQFSNDFTQPQKAIQASPIKQDLVGVDFYIACNKETTDFYKEISQFSLGDLQFQMMSFRGMIFNENANFAKSLVCDYWRCRFISQSIITQSDTFAIAQKLTNAGFTISSVFSLYNYNGTRGFTLAQGQ